MSNTFECSEPKLRGLKKVGLNVALDTWLNPTNIIITEHNTDKGVIFSETYVAKLAGIAETLRDTGYQQSQQSLLLYAETIGLDKEEHDRIRTCIEQLNSLPQNRTSDLTDISAPGAYRAFKEKLRPK